MSLQILGSLATGIGVGVLATSVISPLRIIETNMVVRKDSEVVSVARALLNSPLNRYGFTAFFRGNVAACLSVLVEKLLDETPFNVFTSWTMPLGEQDYSGFGAVARKVPARLATELLVGCFLYPVDLLRTRLAVDASRKAPIYRGFRHCYSRTVGNEGFFALYRGFEAKLLKDLSYYTVRYALEEVLRGIEAPWWAEGLIDISVTLAAKLLCWPLHTVMRRMQMNGEYEPGYGAKYSNSLECFRLTYKEGFRGLFSGIEVGLPRVFVSELFSSATLELVPEPLPSHGPTNSISAYWPALQK